MYLRSWAFTPGLYRPLTPRVAFVTFSHLMSSWSRLPLVIDAPPPWLLGLDAVALGATEATLGLVRGVIGCPICMASLSPVIWWLYVAPGAVPPCPGCPPYQRVALHRLVYFLLKSLQRRRKKKRITTLLQRVVDPDGTSCQEFVPLVVEVRQDLLDVRPNLRLRV